MFARQPHQGPSHIPRKLARIRYEISLPAFRRLSLPSRCRVVRYSRRRHVELGRFAGIVSAR
jgi:hypothetical protein